MATTSNAPRTYLLAANQDSDCRVVLRNEAALSTVGRSAGTLKEDGVDVGGAMVSSTVGVSVVLAAG